MHFQWIISPWIASLQPCRWFLLWSETPASAPADSAHPIILGDGMAIILIFHDAMWQKLFRLVVCFVGWLPSPSSSLYVKRNLSPTSATLSWNHTVSPTSRSRDDSDREDDEKIWIDSDCLHYPTGRRHERPEGFFSEFPIQAGRFPFIETGTSVYLEARHSLFVLLCLDGSLPMRERERKGPKLRPCIAAYWKKLIIMGFLLFGVWDVAG